MVDFYVLLAKIFRQINHTERILVAVKDIDHPFCTSNEKPESDKLHLDFLLDGTRIDNDKYLESLETATELFVAQWNRCVNSLYISI